MKEQILLHNLKKSISNYNEFKSVLNQQIRILSIGCYSPSKGPDFQQSVIDVNGKTYRGDIEVDVRASDWFRHGHHQNPKFKDVILQMYFKDDKPPVRAETLTDRRPFKILLSGRRWSEPPGPDAEESNLKKKDFYGLLPCRDALRRRRTGIRSVVTRIAFLGRKRFLVKAERFRRWAVRFEDPVLLFLKGLFVFLADPANRHRFEALSEKSWFRESLGRRDTRLFHACLASELGLLRLLWDRSSVRPAGAPERRLALFEKILANPAVYGLAAEFECLFDRTADDPGILLREIGRRFRDMGLSPGTSRRAVPNLVLPFLYHRQPRNRTRILWVFSRLTGTENNARIDRFEEWPVPEAIGKTEIFQQGVLGLYERYCLNHCRRCPLFASSGLFRPGLFSAVWKTTG